MGSLSPMLERPFAALHSYFGPTHPSTHLQTLQGCTNLPLTASMMLPVPFTTPSPNRRALRICLVGFSPHTFHLTRDPPSRTIKDKAMTLPHHLDPIALYIRKNASSGALASWR